MNSPSDNSSFLSKDFWKFQFGQLLSTIGDGCGTIALAWWILEQGDSAGTLAAVLTPAMLVRIILTLLLGPVADRVKQKNMLLLGDILRIAAWLGLIGVFLNDRFTVPVVLTLYTVSSIGSALFTAPMMAFVPSLVDSRATRAAFQWMNVLRSVGVIGGGILGGVIASAIGVGTSLTLNAVSFAASALIVLRIEQRPVTTVHARSTGVMHFMRRWADDAIGGLDFVRKHRLLIWMTLFFFAVDALRAELGVTLPFFVRETNAQAPWQLGVLNATLATGSLVGGLTVGRLLRCVSQFRVVAGAMLGMGLGYVSLGFAESPMTGALGSFLIGCSMSQVQIVVQTQLTLVIPEDVRARVFCILGFVEELSSPITIMVVGQALDAAGARSVFLVSAGFAVVLCAIGIVLPHFKELLDCEVRDAPGFLNSVRIRKPKPDAYEGLAAERTCV
jgi:MFS family permease